ncbi:hypothetical protein [Flavobacterium sp. IMCC34518]|uniref:hypothetical protein n=1 Tax=Flavobacterium sp. IMCC34518 TaxID=3003623 RepID=UPI0022AC0C99|nr:hypothetical protein [Flavobacterium sp. IMCC34518]
MKNLFTPLFIIAFVLISCKNEAENQAPKVVVPFYQVANQQQNQTLKTPQPNQSQSLYPAPSAQNTTTQTQTVTAPVTVAKGMNPSHGQPGHRCDIPVGAPLNSPVATTNPSTTQVTSKPTVTVMPSTTSATTTPTPKGMNPPHGQPGHRCDIPVGSPLNSPVAAAKPTPPPAASNYTVTVPTTN